MYIQVGIEMDSAKDCMHAGYGIDLDPDHGPFIIWYQPTYQMCFILEEVIQYYGKEWDLCHLNPDLTETEMIEASLTDVTETRSLAQAN
ncbi:conserved hypothetical protein [Ricinus communis]|uniref:Uncharacterized protein n=1 Tax=Ricinus communis TaxID=3988 RepID=B9RND7_RICCO|nr:conserved hypothetical protein [Ricinus communis]